MILCCGEALIDMLPCRGSDGAEGYRPAPGGSVLNTAISLGRLGRPVSLFTGLSNDLFGRDLEQHLRDSGVDTALAARSPRPSTLAFLSLREGQARYLFYDENSAGRMLTPADLPKLPSGLTALFFGGISLMVDPAASAYEALMARAHSRHPVMLDPNIRPAFIQDVPAYRARLSRMMSMAQIVKLSDEDLAWIMGPGDAEPQIQQLLSRGPKLICLTRGAQGVDAYGSFGKLTVLAPKVDVADTVGAGDTFNGALLAALDQAGLLGFDALAALPLRPLRDALEFAVRAAAVTVSRPGANPPWAKEFL
ncbi:MAG: carbohydrate kinase [Mangrovicoccus sp.]|nr:carbohydrate kinase [Mangrovicoccus sp.]